MTTNTTASVIFFVTSCKIGNKKSEIVIQNRKISYDLSWIPHPPNLPYGPAGMQQQHVLQHQQQLLQQQHYRFQYGNLNDINSIEG
jgi:hypothetical protein